MRELKKKNILVAGDVMLDTYFNGAVKRISPEAPVPVFNKKSENSVLGGAANVAANLIATGQYVSMMSMVGNDKAGLELIEKLKEDNINTDLIVTLERQTTQKTRFLAENHQQVLRLDEEDTNEISHEDCERLLANLKKKIGDFDLILLSDYLKGFLSVELTQGIIELANAHNVKVLVDVKDPNVAKYSHAYLLKPNLKELHDLTGMPVDNDEEIVEAALSLREKGKCEYVLVTCGARGMVLVGDANQYFVDSVGKEVFDVTGAGDTTIAYLAVCLMNGYSMKESVDIANIAAGIQVSKVGTSSVYWNEVCEQLDEKDNAFVEPKKILSPDDVKNFRKDHSDQKIVFTNGCFDILHIGHVRYLKKAAELGDVLVVGVNSDKSVKRLKGPERPINNENDRMELLSSLEFVDYVVMFDTDTPYELIKRIQPDVLVKGGDYKPEEVVGKDIVEARGGRLELIPFVEGKSTTAIINKIKK